MDQATPPWRVIASEAPGAATPAAPDRPVRQVPRWLPTVLATIGGLLAGAAMVVVAVIGSGAVSGPAPAFPGADTLATDPAAGPALLETTPLEVVVDVAGAVVDPGLHRLHEGDRVGDAIEAAGGFAPRADLAASSQSLNLAQPLEDGAKVLVPELGIDRPSSAAAADDGRIDINSAGTSELESLPGIGPVTAGRIIEAREEQRFDAVRELRSRGLVGEKVYEDIKGLVRAG